ncbi:phosphoenolpyruvate-dependent sugar phosphotransferase system, EIIA 2 [Enterococcus aquimarinus]|uniref:Phosphoenolpyruvate-dependent sugar phosphotransferase system, EIIA 2 n=1 Tax=Enterococcus aquimarinus TaxID=328396 RepID=A0A1L8QQP7_9ENTE|nr:phosphoenolpyruvate-dependent sugar phosphotransferase system, EIIA 2 [Enterococcus aquimarinus]
MISEEMIFLDKELTSQEDILKFIVKSAFENDYVEEEDKLLTAVKKRENEISTAIGYLIAIPHGKTEAVKSPFISMVRTSEKVKWTEDNDEMVRLVFLIGVPEKSEGKLHLKFISQLSKKLLDDSFRGKLLNKKNKNEIFEQLSSIEI